jgi:hypothetical protein
MSLEDTGPFMKNAIVRAAMKEINHWKGLTNEHELDPRWQELHRDKPTFESYADSALDEIREKVFQGDYVIPLDMVGMKEMKMNKADLRRIIKEEISRLSEMRRSPVDPEGYDYDASWQAEQMATALPRHWRPRQRAAWNKLKEHRPEIATPDNYSFFETAYNRLLPDPLRDTHNPVDMASMLSLVALESEGQGPPGGMPGFMDLPEKFRSLPPEQATTGHMDLDEKLRGLPPGHVDLSKLSESRIDLGRWNKMAGTLLCEAGYYEKYVQDPRYRTSGTLADEEADMWSTDPYPEEEEETDLEAEQAMFDEFETRTMQGGVQRSFLDWANQVLVSRGLPTATAGDDSNLYQIGDSMQYGMPIEAWRSGVKPSDYATTMEVLPPRTRA